MPAHLDRLLEHIDSLPSLPTVVLRVNDLMSNPKTSALQLSRLILDDQALTARLLRLVNSPFYGFPRRIATVTEAVTILGFQPVRNLLLTATVVDVLGGEEHAEFSPASLWEHALAAGVAAGLLARSMRYEDREEVFVGGLLHDVGKLVLFQFLRRDFLRALGHARAADVPLRVAEQKLLGFTHDHVGQLLAERWRLPVRLSEAIGHHHRPERAPIAKREAALVHLGDILARALALGSGGDDAVPALQAEAWARLGLPPAVLGPLLDELEGQYADAREILLSSLPDEQVPGTAHAR
ncbi:MAG: HDOD domain-containing protein [Candidatus Methylomirabilales bacterium]